MHGPCGVSSKRHDNGAQRQRMEVASATLLQVLFAAPATNLTSVHDKICGQHGFGELQRGFPQQLVLIV
jgi:hypothetical protein